MTYRIYDGETAISGVYTNENLAKLRALEMGKALHHSFIVIPCEEKGT